EVTIIIIVTSIPTALIGLVFNDFFERMFTSIHIIGYTLLLTGVLLWLSSKISMGTKKAKDIKATDAITIGLFQGIAIMPGISRSGSTIFAAMLMGFNPQLATKFSFLVSIPVILGAALLEARKVLIAGEGFMDILPVIIGFTVAAISGYLAIKLLVDLINRKKLYFFSYYCWGAGIFIILYSLIVH
ncbi:MAG TPA: undecaprenyl-diphosphate phosphatase, partial [Clostridia bacterium]|nr:undecaprenyl-diphosphate phosphatase [Clostridia bacterium]